MSIVAVYEVEPLPTDPLEGDDTNGDTGQLQQKVGNAPSVVDALNFYVGTEYNGTNDLPRQGFFRFEVSKPQSATIIGVRFEAFASADGENGPIPMYGGFLKRQITGDAWESARGVAVWDIDHAIPLVDYNSAAGLQHDESVFWGGAPGYAETNHATVDVLNFWTIGDGTFTGTAANAPGLMAQLQSYLDDADNEATRGSTKAGAVPVMFTVLRDFVGTRDQFQPMQASDGITSAWRPKLRVEYNLGAAVDAHAVGVPRLRSAVSGLAHLEGAVSGVAAARAAVAGRPSVSSAVTGSASVRDAVRGRGRIR